MGRALFTEASGDFESIDGMTPVKMFGHEAAFVGLQRTNKVPLQPACPGLLKVADFLHPFLNIVFAKRDLACGHRFFDSARRFRFTDCKQRNFFWSTAAACGSG